LSSLEKLHAVAARSKGRWDVERRAVQDSSAVMGDLKKQYRPTKVIVEIVERSIAAMGFVQV
jgi:hypothetical protein